jgi:hypothetical protein
MHVYMDYELGLYYMSMSTAIQTVDTYAYDVPVSHKERKEPNTS